MDIKTSPYGYVMFHVKHFKTNPRYNYTDAMKDVKNLVKDYQELYDDLHHMYIQLQAPSVMASNNKVPSEYQGFAKGLVIPKYLEPYLVKQGEFNERTL